MSDLKPCPFCGANDYRVSRHHASDIVSCGHCCGENSVDWWNTRPIEDALRAELDDIKASHRAIMEEQCPTDERHCSCVPFLRRELETARTENHWNRMKTAEKREDGLRDELKQLRSKAVEMVSEIQSELDAANRRIAELEAENAALTAERDHARQDAATVRLQLAETQRPFTVTVEIPEPIFMIRGYPPCCGTRSAPWCPIMSTCSWKESRPETTWISPGPGCPRYHREGR